jgi:hypothetical protein
VTSQKQYFLNGMVAMIVSFPAHFELLQLQHMMTNDWIFSFLVPAYGFTCILFGIRPSHLMLRNPAFPTIIFLGMIACLGAFPMSCLEMANDITVATAVINHVVLLAAQQAMSLVFHAIIFNVWYYRDTLYQEYGYNSAVDSLFTIRGRFYSNDWSFGAIATQLLGRNSVIIAIYLLKFHVLAVTVFTPLPLNWHFGIQLLVVGDEWWVMLAGLFYVYVFTHEFLVITTDDLSYIHVASTMNLPGLDNVPVEFGYGEDCREFVVYVTT